ncbi:hypothetical protein CDAR_86241 [Caerostris darwini]|uniref:Uncharacterized protein n=1 Tax=Caerostris darwini TaxID=1538125 RepID=A0AAV4NPK0_9ARAC|nr:hypothetical protein CDAR_86241 [Caerostris darwini]
MNVGKQRVSWIIFKNQEMNVASTVAKTAAANNSPAATLPYFLFSSPLREKERKGREKLHRTLGAHFCPRPMILTQTHKEEKKNCLFSIPPAFPSNSSNRSQNSSCEQHSSSNLSLLPVLPFSSPLRERNKGREGRNFIALWEPTFVPVRCKGRGISR